jgi:hypothetical protein
MIYVVLRLNLLYVLDNLIFSKGISGKKVMTMVIFGLVFMLTEVCFGAESPVTETPKIVSCLATMVALERKDYEFNVMQTFYSKNSGNLSVRLSHHNPPSLLKTVVLLDCMQADGKIKNALRGLLNNNMVLPRDDRNLLNNVLADKPGHYSLGGINVVLRLSGCKDLEAVAVDRIEITGEPEELLGFKEVTLFVKNDEIVLMDENGLGGCTIFDAANRAELLKQLEKGVPFGIELTQNDNQLFNCKVKGYCKNSGLWWKWGIIPYWKQETEKISFGNPISKDVSLVAIDRRNNARAQFNYQMIKYLKSLSMIAAFASIGYFLTSQF